MKAGPFATNSVWSKLNGTAEFKGAECAKPGMDPGLWTDDHLDSYEKRRAKQICFRCCCIEECFRYAMNNPELDGIWGGTDEYERRRTRKRRVTEIANKEVVSR